MKQNQLRQHVLLALFIAIEILLFSVPQLGLIRIGTIEITTLHIPVIIASAVLGMKAGIILGGVFGLLSFVNATLSTAPHAFLFSPFVPGGNFSSLIISFVPRIILGILPAYLIKISPFSEKITIPMATVVATFVHTLSFLIFTILFFAQRFTTLYGQPIETILYVILVSNGLVEALVAMFVASPTIIALKHYYIK